MTTEEPGECGGKNPTGEYPGELLNDLLIIGGNGVAVAIQLSSTVLIQHESADGEKLQDFARVIFIGLRVKAVSTNVDIRWCSSLASIVQHVEETTHGRV